MIEIPLTQGQVAFVSNEDADLLELKWYAVYQPDMDNYYARRNKRLSTKRFTERMHRVVLSRMLGRELERHEQVDHEDLNPLNNCRDNLRLSNGSENKGNQRKYATNKSGYKGVHWHKQHQKWYASIMVMGKSHFLGLHTDLIEAAKAYDKAAIQYFGEFARVNFDG